MEIIAVSGPPGSGKSTIGFQLVKQFGKKITVKDADDLRNKLILRQYKLDINKDNFNYKMFESDKFQRYIDEFIIEHQKKPMVFVGLNVYPWHKKMFYNMHAKHRFYIDIDPLVIVEQRCVRSLTRDMQTFMDRETINDITQDNKKFLKLLKKYIENECNIKTTLKEINYFNKEYKKKGYKFLSRDKILSEVSKLINKMILKK